MLISDYSSEILTLGYTQLAVSIALSRLGEDKASRAVAAFYGLNSNETKVSDVSVIYKENRVQVEQRLTSGKDNMIDGFVKYVSEVPCLVIVDAGTHKKTSRTVTLLELLEDPENLNRIYQTVMIMLAKNSLTSLIGLYIDTKEYKEYFEHDVSKYFRLSADKTRTNDLSASIMSALLADFKRFVLANACTGAYDPNTGTPSAYLRHTFICYYRMSDNVREILNTKGTNLDTGGDSDMTIAEYQTISDKFEAKSIDFIDIANKINRASHLLFNHNGNPLAFYDILSCYRESRIQSRMKDDKLQFANVLPGCTITYEDSSNILNCGNENTINNKKNSRISLCRLFSRIVDEGLSQGDVYQYYRDAMALTASTPHHDGRRLFTYVDKSGMVKGKTNHVENNSQMMQIIISGHLALRELVQYLSKENSPCSIYNFPTLIFRNREYLYRFQTLEEYVSYIYDVAPLVEEVKNDPVRSLHVINDCYYDNDSMWKLLGVSNLMHDNTFEKLTSMPLSFIRSAVSDSQALSKDELFEKKYNALSYKFRLMVDVKNKCGFGNSLTEKHNALEMFGNTILTSKFDSYSNFNKYGIALAFYDCLLETLKAEGKPPYKNDYYLYKQENLAKEFTMFSQSVKTLIEKDARYKNIFIKQAKIRIMCVAKLYAMLTGNTEVKICDWEELREFFCIMETIKGLISRLYTKGLVGIANEVHSGENFAFLLVARMAEEAKEFAIPQVISSCDELSTLYRSENIPALFISKIKTVEECIELNQRRDNALLVGVNRFLESFGNDYEVFELGDQLINKYVSKKYASVSKDAELNDLLYRASCDAQSFNNLGKINRRVQMWLKGVASLDEFGYVIRNGHRVKLDDNTYVLGRGLLITISPDKKHYSVGVMTEDDEQILSYKWSLKGDLI